MELAPAVLMVSKAMPSNTILLVLLPLVIIELALMAVAYRDLFRSDRVVVGGNKWIWAIVILISYVGPILYFVMGREER